MISSLNFQTFGYLLVIAVTLSCRDTIERPFPKLVTLPVSEVNADGATFSAQVDGEIKDMADHGFVWYVNSRQPFTGEPGDAGKFSLGSNLQGRTFSVRVTSGLAPQKNYYVRAYLKSGEYWQYGDEIPFRSEGSKSNLSFKASPSQVVPGDTVSISGEIVALYNTSQFKVTWAFTELPLLAKVGNELKILVPKDESLGSTIVIQTPAGVSDPIPAPALVEPEIKRVSPNAIGEGDTILIEGKNFSPISDWNEVFFNYQSGIQIVSATRNQIKAVSFSVTGWDMVAILVKNGTFESEEFIVAAKKAEIISFSPASGSTGDTIILKGRYLPGMGDQFSGRIQFGENFLFGARREDHTKLILTVFDYNIGKALSYTDRITITNGFSTLLASSSEKFSYVQKDWKIVTDLPSATDAPNGFIWNGNLFYFSGTTLGAGYTWSENTTAFNPLNLNLPQGLRNKRLRASTYIGNRLFLLTAGTLNDQTITFDAWLYDPSNSTWEKLPDFTIKNERFTDNEENETALFTIDNKVYACFAGNENLNRVFDMDTQSWTPFKSLQSLFGGNAEIIFPESATTLNGIGYLLFWTNMGRYLASYQPESDTWSLVSKVTDEGYFYQRSAFVFRNQVSFLSSEQGDFKLIQFDPSSGQLKTLWLASPPSDIGFQPGGQVFMLNDKLYLAQGEHLYQWFPRD